MITRKWLLCALLICCPFVSAQVETLRLRNVDILRVYDGDTFYITLTGIPPVLGEDLGVRIKNIDTPEMRSGCSTTQLKERERELARGAQMALSQLLINAKTIQLQNLSRDKYFRIDADVIVDNLDVAGYLIQQRFALPYDGTGQRPDWCAYLQ